MLKSPSGAFQRHLGAAHVRAEMFDPNLVFNFLVAHVPVR
jgi:hypothetical protein